MSIGDDVLKYVYAGFSGLWIKSREPRDARAEIAEECTKAGLLVFEWNPLGELSQASDMGWSLLDGVGDPSLQGALEWFGQFRHPQWEDPDTGQPTGQVTPGILLLRGAAEALAGNVVLQELLGRLMEVGTDRTIGKTYVVLSEDADPPLSLESMVLPLVHGLPGPAQLDKLIDRVLAEDEQPQGELREQLVKAAMGLSTTMAEGAFALSVAETGEADPRLVAKVKAQLLNRGNQALTLMADDIGFDQVGGLRALKDYTRTVLSRTVKPHERPRGIMLLGVPGTGKSLFVKALGKETGRPVLHFDVGLSQSKYVGESDRQLAEVFAKARMMAPCVLYISEVEKALAGAGSDSSGTKTNIMGRLLDFMQDTQEEVYTVLTCNKIQEIVDRFPEFTRRGRLDRIFFLDYPTAEDKREIWRIHLDNHGMADQPLPADHHWTGSEIEHCVREAKLLDKTLAEVAQTMAIKPNPSIDASRDWASGYCHSAEVEGLYQKTEPQAELPQKPQRRAGQRSLRVNAKDH